MVPPGRGHCVVNLQPCVKFAWEVCRPGNLGLYAQCLQDGGVAYFGSMNAPDYMWLGKTMFQAVSAVVKNVKKP